MADNAQPLNTRIPIVDEDGKPTDFFIRWAKQFSGNTANIDALAGKVDSGRKVNTGTGLSGGGDLSADRTLSLDASLDNLNDVDTTTTPPTDGQALVFDNASGLWLPGDVASGGGGGGSSYTPPKQADYTLVNDGGVVSWLDTTDGLSMMVGVGGTGTQMRCALKAYPSTPINAIFKMRSTAFGQGSDGCGLIIRDSVGGRLIKFGIESNEQFLMQRWTNVSSFSTTVATFIAIIDEPWFRFTDDGTTFNFYVGLTKDGPWGLVASEPRASWLTSPNQIGWGLEDQAYNYYFLLIQHLQGF